MIKINLTSLDKKGINEVAYQLHKSMNDYNLLIEIVSNYSLESLINTKNSGIISNLLLYYVSIGDDYKINEILKNNEILLMKRDCLILAKYYYKIDINKSNSFFRQILERSTTNTGSIIQSKDIDFIIENKMHNLLYFIEGLFVESNLNYNLLDSDKLKLKYLDNCILLTLRKHVESILGLNSVLWLEKFINNQNFVAIIDGGNVLHSRNGTLDSNSLKDLVNLIILVRQTIGKPLLVIHQRHLKIFPDLINILNELKVKRYITPYNNNDDIFIIWFFLKLGSKPFIISNDQYRDHIFKFETSKKILNNQFSFSQFNNILQQQTLSYNITEQTINPIPKYSKCIQVINTSIYVPHLSGKFIELKR